MKRFSSSTAVSTFPEICWPFKATVNIFFLENRLSSSGAKPASISHEKERTAFALEGYEYFLNREAVDSPGSKRSSQVQFVVAIANTQLVTSMSRLHQNLHLRIFDLWCILY